MASPSKVLDSVAYIAICSDSLCRDARAMVVNRQVVQPQKLPQDARQRKLGGGVFDILYGMTVRTSHLDQGAALNS